MLLGRRGPLQPRRDATLYYLAVFVVAFLLGHFSGSVVHVFQMPQHSGSTARVLSAVLHTGQAPLPDGGVLAQAMRLHAAAPLGSSERTAAPSPPASDPVAGAADSTALRTASQAPASAARLNAMSIPGAISAIPSRSSPATAFSPDFDWLAYLDYNADVKAYKFTSETLVKRHYQWMGETEKRLYQRIPIVVRYSACGGLMNQHYSHLTALVLASALGADVAMPVSLTRDSFASYYSLNPALNQVTWRPIAQESFYDLDALEALLAERGGKLWLVPAEAGQPNFHDQRNAYPTWLPSGFDERQRVRYGGGPESRLYLQAAPLADIVHEVSSLVVRHARDLVTSSSLTRPPTILLDLPCTLFGLDMCSATAEGLSADIAKRLLFSPRLQALADKVVARIGGPFNGLHLRLEKDAKDWAMMSGGPEALEKMYWTACDNNGFDQSVPLYLATGLLSYNDTAKMASVTAAVNKFSKSLHYKELYLGSEDLRGLSSDQLSAVDFLVLTRSERFVGIGSSTFSWFIREYRALLGHHEHTSLFVHTQHIGTDPLFNRAAKLPRIDRIFRSASHYGV